MGAPEIGLDGVRAPNPRRAPAQPSAPSARALYVTGGASTRVDRDGPSLVVRAVGRADARFPLTRVARVVTGSRVQWRADAVLACLEHGIPVIYLGVDGGPIGHLQPVSRRRSTLDALIEEFLDRPDWAVRYQNWMRSERMRAFDAWRRGRESDARPISEADSATLIRQYVYGEGSSSRLTLCGASYSAALKALVAQNVTKAGLRGVYWGVDGAPLELVADLTELLALRLELELCGLGTSARLNSVAILRVFHVVAPRLSPACGTILGRLHRRLREVIEEWS